VIGNEYISLTSGDPAYRSACITIQKRRFTVSAVRTSIIQILEVGDSSTWESVLNSRRISEPINSKIVRKQANLSPSLSRTLGRHLQNKSKRKKTLCLQTVWRTVANIFRGLNSFTRAENNFLSNVWFARKPAKDVGNVASSNICIIQLAARQGETISERNTRLAASRRRPSAPRDKRSFAYVASLARTYSVSVARLDDNLVRKICERVHSDSYSARFTNSHVCTCARLV